jgi:hypothetical protein
MWQRHWKACLYLVGCLVSATTAQAADFVVRQFPNGTDGNAVGIVDASEDVDVSGPQALTADEEGNLYLLDQLNGRIMRFDPRDAGTDPRVLGLPDDLQPTDLVVRRADIMVWDGSIHTLHEPRQGSPDEPSFRSIEPTVRKLEEVSTRGVDDDFAMSAFAQMGSQRLGDEDELLNQSTRAIKRKEARPRARQFVATRGLGSVAVDVIPDKTESTASIEVRRFGEFDSPALAQFNLKIKDRLGAVEFLEIDYNGRIFMFVESIPANSTRAAAFVTRHSATGALEGIYELPLSNVPLSRRFVAVTGTGDVYFLRTQSAKVDVLGIGFRSMPNAKLIDVRPPPPPPTTTAKGPTFPATKGGPVTAARPLTRQSVVETAFAFESIQWRVTPAAYGRDPDTACTGFNGRVRRPGYLHGKINQEVRGIPYCWGCMGSLAQVRDRIERGTMAGNICTQNNPRTDVAGVDCSAFVSATWGLSTHFTTAVIPTIADRLSNPWDLKPGDALNKPNSHVMLFLRFTPDRKAEVMESSTGGCNGKVCRNIYPLASLLARGYVPVRYRALAKDNDTVAQLPEPKKEEPKKEEPKKKEAQPKNSHRR